MNHYMGIDVSLEFASVCVVDGSGKIVREDKVASEPEALILWLVSQGVSLARVGLEAGPLSQWLFAALRRAGLAVELLETRHVRVVLCGLYRLAVTMLGTHRTAGVRQANLSKPWS